MKMKRRILLISLLLISVWTVFAQDQVQFKANAPSTVILDRPFQLVYTVNATGKDIRVPELNFFDILAGPFESRSSSYQIINGKATSSVSVSYTYTLQAQKTGTFSVPPASITVDGEKYTSNGLSIKVLPADDPSAQTQRSQGAQSGAQQGAVSSQEISNEQVFIRTHLSKTNAYEQEAILVTYKLYTLVDVVQCVNRKMPDFNGFMKQEIEQSQNKQFSYENYNGKNYGTVVLYQILVFPQRSGEIIIDRAEFEAVIRVQNRRQVRSIFDDFFDSYSNVQKTLSAPSAKINASALPANRPAGFSGVVGRFTMNSDISTQSLKANEAVTLKVTINGSGNMKMINNPEFKFPEGFEVYDPKVSNNFKTSAAGVSGSKVIEYVIIPRHQGNFEIPSAEFSYFDVQSKSYKTLRTPAYSLKVAKGEGGGESPIVGNYVSKEDVKQLGQDIRYINTDHVVLYKEKDPIFGTWTGWLIYLIPLLVTLILYFLFRKQAKDNANIGLIKNRKANTVAQKRLKLAKKLLNEGNKDKYYEEVIKAVWTYLSDKLSIPVAELSKERVVAELETREVRSELSAEFIQILNTCEFARFAPNSGQEEMGNLFDETVNAISALEGLLKK